MKEVLDAISLCRMIVNEGLKNGKWKETDDFVKEYFANTQFENEFVKQQFEMLARDIVGLRNSYEYFIK